MGMVDFYLGAFAKSLQLNALWSWAPLNAGEEVWTSFGEPMSVLQNIGASSHLEAHHHNIVSVK
jgi:hypothetical protein